MERRNHINYLELLAVKFAVKSFAKDRRYAHIHLKMDNRTAVFYVNHTEGTHSPVMSRFATQLWQWCLERKKHIAHCRTPPWDRELHSRQKVQDNSISGRVAGAPRSIQADSGDSGQMQHKSVCNTIQCPAGAFCGLEARSQCSWDGCTTTSMGQMGGVCFPSFLPHWKMS